MMDEFKTFSEVNYIVPKLVDQEEDIILDSEPKDEPRI
jgi:hypothetical protein